MARIIAIIPTYNENDSIGRLIDALEREFGKIQNHDFEIVVVDANSPDGTAETVKERKKLYKNIELIVEKKRRGLGLAYIAGMRRAIGQLGADAIIEFDGDWQHNPEDIKRLVAEFDNGYDYVIGSRYVSGGGVPEEWGWHRKLLSKYGSLFIRWALHLSVHDATSGFKLSRVAGFAEKMPLSEKQILSKRHAYKIHLLYEMIKRGAKVKEVPIVFSERQRGSSKSAAEDIFESLKVVFILWIRSLKN